MPDRGATEEGAGAEADPGVRTSVGQAIVERYARVPQAGDDLERSDGSTVAMIAEEPW